jgi:hypothetical protein
MEEFCRREWSLLPTSFPSDSVDTSILVAVSAITVFVLLTILLGFILFSDQYPFGGESRRPTWELIETTMDTPCPQEDTFDCAVES